MSAPNAPMDKQKSYEVLYELMELLVLAATSDENDIGDVSKARANANPGLGRSVTEFFAIVVHVLRRVDELLARSEHGFSDVFLAVYMNFKSTFDADMLRTGLSATLWHYAQNPQTAPVFEKHLLEFFGNDDPMFYLCTSANALPRWTWTVPYCSPAERAVHLKNKVTARTLLDFLCGRQQMDFSK